MATKKGQDKRAEPESVQATAKRAQADARAQAEVDPTPAPDEVREEAVAVYLGEKDAEDASEAALEELAYPSEVRAADAGMPPVGGVRPGVTLGETEGHPETPTTWDEQSIAEFQQKHRTGKGE